MKSTGISDTGSTNIYYDHDDPLLKLDPASPRVHMGTANGRIARSSATSKASIPQIAHDFPNTGYVMTNFKHTLVGIVFICDAGCKVTFYDQDVTVFAPNSRAILTG